MLTPNSFPWKALINFSLVAPQVLGNGYEGAQVLGTVDASQALTISPNIPTVHADIYNVLQPLGVANDYTSYPYVVLLLSDGNRIALGIPWCVDASLVIQQTQTMTIVCQTQSPEDQNTVRIALSAAGIKNFTVTLS
jgi:hypothetical protein